MDKRILAIAMVAIFIIPMCSVFIIGDDVEADTKTVVVETSPDFAPYDYYYGDEFVGIDMDILRAISLDTGIKIVFRQNNFDSIILSVTQGKCDFGASGFTISDERKKEVNFTDSYATIRQVVVAKAGLNLTSENDVRGKTISVQTGTSGADYAETLSSNITYQKGYTEVVLDLINNKAFCEVVDDAVGMAQVSAHPELQVYDILEAEPEYYGFVFSKGNSDLYDTINSSLKKLKTDGTVDKIVNYYADNGYALDTPSYYSQVNTLFVLISYDVPFSYLTNGNYAGVDIDILKAICKDIGYKLKFKQVEFENIIDSILENPTYIGASGITITDYRKDLVSFTDPYLNDKYVVLAPKDSDIKSVEDLEGKTIGAVKGADTEKYALDKGLTVHGYDNSAMAATGVMTNSVSCAIVDHMMAESMVNANPDKLEILDILTDSEALSYGFMISYDSSNLYEVVNTSLQKLIADGTVQKIIDYYSSHQYSEKTPSMYNEDDSGSFFDQLWKRFKKDFIDMDRYTYLTNGLANTLKITALALIMGMVIGSIAAMVISMSAQTGKLKISSAIFRLYITVIRGTPVMVQLLIIYYVVFASANMNQILIASIAFGLNSGAYVAEVIRSGINSVPKGQMEAARSLGLSTGTSMKLVILPQAIRNILPALGNEAITLIKETSVAGYIGVMELTRGADIIRGQTYDALLPLLVIAIVYLAIVLVLQYLIRRMEKRLNNAY